MLTTAVANELAAQIPAALVARRTSANPPVPKVPSRRCGPRKAAYPSQPNVATPAVNVAARSSGTSQPTSGPASVNPVVGAV